MKNQVKVSDFIAKFLSKKTKHVFVGQGGSVVHLLDSINKTPASIASIPCWYSPLLLPIDLLQPPRASRPPPRRLSPVDNQLS